MSPAMSRRRPRQPAVREFFEPSPGWATHVQMSGRDGLRLWRQRHRDRWRRVILELGSMSPCPCPRPGYPPEPNPVKPEPEPEAISPPPRSGRAVPDPRTLNPYNPSRKKKWVTKCVPSTIPHSRAGRQASAAPSPPAS